jgi:hypothetical protein
MPEGGVRMEKVMVAIGRVSPLDAGDGDALRSRIFESAVAALRGTGLVRAMSLSVHDTTAAHAPSPAPSPDGTVVPAAIVSLWVDSYQCWPELLEALSIACSSGDQCSVYLVTESVVEDYGTTAHARARDWADGERSPGVVTVATFNRPVGVAERDWLHAWHEVQSPRSGEMQPRCRYVRNRVVQALGDESPHLDGIVEEAWPSAEVVGDPMRFFNTGGDPSALALLMSEMLDNVAAALDLSTLRSVTMSEYLNLL